MKKLLGVIIITGLAISLFSQEIVTTNPQLKAAVIENFTGVNCPFCPQGATAMQNAINSNPGKVFGIGVHAGFFAVPESGQPDFRTSFGDALVSQANISGFPSATVNRHYFPDLSANGGTGMDRTRYGTASARIIQQPAYANIGFNSSFNPDTRELTVDVEVYYVENLPFGIESNFINIAITEDNIIGYQAGGGSSYSHQKVLRHFITGQWGDEISDLSAGSLITKSYTYTLDDDWVAENCNIVAFVTETRQEIINAAQAPLIDGSHNGIITPDYGRIFTDESILGGEEGEMTEFNITVINGLDQQSEFEITLDYNAPEGWNIGFIVDSQIFYDNVTLSIDNLNTEQIKVFVTPNDVAGIAQCKLYISSVDNPSLPEKMTEMFVVYNVDNLIVNGSGTNTPVNAEDYQDVYINALSNAGSTSIGAIPGYALEEAYEKNILDGVSNIYMNVGYTIPVLTVGQTNLLTDFIDNGGNVFIAGQDIARDIMSVSGFSTAITQKTFLQNYLGVAYVNFGDDNNNVISFVEDPIFYGIPDSDLFDPYGEGLHPDNVIQHGTGIKFINFPNNRAAGIRNIKNEGKIVYLSFGLEQIEDVAVRDSIMLRTYKWFNGWEGESNVETIAMNDFKIYPNPATDNISISFENEINNFEISIFSIEGKLIYKTIANSKNVNIDISEFTNGLYLIQIKSEEKTYNSRFIKL